MSEVRMGLVGYGYWGPNLARNFSETPGITLGGVCDLRPPMLETVAKRYPGVFTTTSFDELISRDDIDAVAIATPVSTHADLAIRALDAGKHVLVEKPLSDSVASSKKVIEAAQRAGKVLLVDHTFVYMGAVRKVKEIVDSGDLGDIHYFDSVRVNLGLYQHDISVVWDLAVHDLSILGYWIPRRPVAVSCLASGHLAGHPQDVGYLTLTYDDNFIVHVHVNWLSPVKIRRTILGGRNKTIIFDDLDPIEKIKIYDRGVTVPQPQENGSTRVYYRRTGDIYMPQFDMTEALQTEVLHFRDCILNGAAPLTGGPAALQVVEILEAAEESIRQQGKLVELPRH